VAIYDFPTSSKGTWSQSKGMCVTSVPDPGLRLDVPKGSIIYTEYITALNKLLRVLVQTGSVDLLHVLFPVLREQNHVHEAAISQAVQAFITHLSSDDTAAQEAFALCFEAFLVCICYCGFYFDTFS
jgi:hypothetical protein